MALARDFDYVFKDTAGQSANLCSTHSNQTSVEAVSGAGCIVAAALELIKTELRLATGGYNVGNT